MARIFHWRRESPTWGPAGLSTLVTARPRPAPAIGYAAHRGGTRMGEALVGGVVSMLLVSLLSSSSFVGALVYVVASWRTYREGLPVDPQLGLKTAIAFFHSISLLMSL